jgi:phosphatidylglycerophosphate synthase
VTMPGPTTARSRDPARRARTDRGPLAPPVTGAAGLATKGDEVEEWLDLRFFRPIGARIAHRLADTRVTPDQVTLVSLVIGLVAGHLFVYASPLLNGLGFGLFIVSDLFDSADGQLARLRGTSTRFGRVLDGISDSVRFANLAAHLLIRLTIVGGWSWPLATALVVGAAFSHSTQSAAIDFIRHSFLALAVGRGGEIDLEDMPVPPGASWPRRLAVSIYRVYTRRQARMFPRSAALLRAKRDHTLTPAAAAAYRVRTAPLLRPCVWLGQNIRFIILGLTATLGWPAGLLWISLGPMNVLLIWLVREQERVASGVMHADGTTRPVPPAPPAVAVGGD